VQFVWGLGGRQSGNGVDVQPLDAGIAREVRKGGGLRELPLLLRGGGGREGARGVTGQEGSLCGGQSDSLLLIIMTWNPVGSSFMAAEVSVLWHTRGGG
jgi:hypothetical protein